ncbi:ImmA/IrrE family metallo-endopeptidase [Clostridium butyricum]|uniref:ImmA/IrrE family metallo-endopeptidase n=1 Tax=Clostridium butyricum TaxID=1492 RepID=UPI00374EC035
MEWQANYFSGAILMPRSMVFKLCDDEELKDSLTFMSFGNKEEYNNLLIKCVAQRFNVSKKAAEVRLCCLGIINTENTEINEISFL